MRRTEAVQGTRPIPDSLSYGQIVVAVEGIIAVVTQSSWLAIVFAATLLASACTANGGAEDTGTGTDPASTLTSRMPDQSARTKMLLIVEENKSYDQVVGASEAPYLNRLAQTYGLATAYDAGYAVDCASLGAYLIMLSGDDHSACADVLPEALPVEGDNLFQQVAESGREWRVYAESMPVACDATNTSDGLYLVRHAPAPYFVSERGRCPRWDIPLGSSSSGPLVDDLAQGTLPAFALVTPNACDDMHGAPSCSTDTVAAGDRWLSTLMPKILAGEDYRAGRLVVVIAWDEGTSTDNHIPAIVISPKTSHVVSSIPFTHCSLLRTFEEVLGLPLLGCAAEATSMAHVFGLPAG